MLRNDAEALERGFEMFGSKSYKNETGIVSGVENVIERVCMYCGKKYGEVQTSATGRTHGICKECMEARHPAEALAANADGYQPPGSATGIGTTDNVAPPGMEHVVKALKKEPGIDNPFAVAWSMYTKKNDDSEGPIAAVRGSNEGVLKKPTYGKSEFEKIPHTKSSDGTTAVTKEGHHYVWDERFEHWARTF